MEDKTTAVKGKSDVVEMLCEVDNVGLLMVSEVVEEAATELEREEVLEVDDNSVNISDKVELIVDSEVADKDVVKREEV